MLTPGMPAFTLLKRSPVPGICKDRWLKEQTRLEQRLLRNQGPSSLGELQFGL
jgi:hypothetical protein